MTKEEKEARKLMDSVDEINPYSCYLDESTLSNVDNWIDTGSLALNAIISGSLYKGLPEGRLIQFAGPSQCGKSFFIQKIIANAQKMGKHVIVFDSENAIEPAAAKKFGIDITKVKYVKALTLENTRNAIFNFLSKVAETKRLGEFVIIIDSLANLESELAEKRMGKDSTSADMGTFAKSVKALLKTCTNWSSVTKTTIVFTNHIYDDPSAMYPSFEKNITGGKSPVYLPSVNVQMNKLATKDDEGKTIDNTLATAQKSFSGVKLGCTTTKNRFVRPYLEVELYVSFETGLDRYYGLLKLMRGTGVVVLDGHRYNDWEGNSLGFYKNWRTDESVWEKLLPELEIRLQKEWAFSSETPLEEDYPDEEIVEKVSDNPLDALDALKNLKNKVTKKLDKLEEEIDYDEMGSIGLAGEDND